MNFTFLSTWEQKNVHTVYVKQDCVCVSLFRHSNWGLITKGTIGSPVGKRPPYKQKRNNGRTPFAGVYKFMCVCVVYLIIDFIFNRFQKFQNHIGIAVQLNTFKHTQSSFPRRPRTSIVPFYCSHCVWTYWSNLHWFCTRRPMTAEIKEPATAGTTCIVKFVVSPRLVCRATTDTPSLNMSTTIRQIR